MSDDPYRDAAAAERMLPAGQAFSLEASAGSGDWSESWLGYESAFPVPIDEMAEADAVS